MTLLIPMDELVKIVEEGFESEKMKVLAEVEERIESAKRSIITRIESFMKDGNQTSARTNMKLEFRNGIARTIFTGEEIKGEGGVPIEVALVDDSAGDVVDAGAEASADIEIVLLKGKSEGDDFKANIVPEVEGKKPILAGNVALKLQRGICAVKNVKFKHYASKIKPSEFKLGARVVGDCRIKEAKTELFILKDFRAKYYEKRKNPSLSDEVSRLVCIRRGGKIDKRLEDNKIYTVEDFLIQLLINPQGLKSIVKSQAKKWEAIVNNARACLSGERVYFYMDPEQKTGIIFDILGHVGHVLGLCSGGYYSQTSTLSEEQKEKLLASAYKNWEGVKAFDDQNSLQQHLSCLGTSMDPSDSQKPECPGGGHEITTMVGESSTRLANVSYLNTSSTINNELAWRDSGRQDFISFNAGSDEKDIIYDAQMQLLHSTDKADGEELLASLNDVYYPQQQQLNGTYEMVGESSSRCSNTSFRSVNLTVGDSWWCDGVNWRDVHPPSPNPMLYYADNTQMYGHRDDETRADEGVAEPQVTANPPYSWKI